MVHPIIFPGLGLRFTIDPIAIKFMGINVHWYGIILVFAILLPLGLALKQARKYEINPDDIVSLILYVIPLAIIGARLYYVIFRWDIYKNNLSEIFSIWNGGLAIYGGIISAVIVAFIFAKKKKISVLKLFDFLVPYLALGQCIGRWGNFVNQEAHGVATSLLWRMEIFDPVKMQYMAVHPTFLYESLWNAGLFIFLILYRRKKKFNGEIFLLYLALYGLARFFIEGLRTDSLYIGVFRISQLLAAILFVVSTILFLIIHFRQLKHK